ncbi:MAG: dUTP diphosphatase [Rhodospirillaceae bacterium]|jgi:dUTP pyrophosphatase|nr:dUTP diphosphatase [Rhodospirillaceae bacterium]MBT7954784.1 dUTP diphosphatase [Rhodospirillaceae bacterium]
MSRVKVAVQRLDHGKDLPLPEIQTELSAGVDLLAAIDSDIELAPGGRTIVPTGLAIALPAGFEAQIRPRSGLAHKKGVTVLNSPGTIDADYRGEIGAIMINHGQEIFTIERGMRIAQMVVAPVAGIEWDETETLPETTRGAGGFGSTGTDEK